MAALPYMQLYVADYLADTAHLTTEEHGAYLLLLFNYWQTGKPLRSDRLATVARMGNDRWKSVEITLAEFFRLDVNPGYWTHLRVEADLHQLNSKSRQASDAGKKSALSRARAKQGSQTDVPTDVPTDSQRNANHTRSRDTDTDTDTDTEQDQKHSSTKSKKAVTPKPEFQLPAWITEKAWSDYVDMRKKIKKPITENAKVLAVRALEKLALAGQNPDAVLNQSTLNSWQGLFEVKNGTGQTFSGAGRPERLSLVDRVKQANAHLLDDEYSPPGLGDFDGEFERIREVDGSLVGDDGGDVWPQVE